MNCLQSYKKLNFSYKSWNCHYAKFALFVSTLIISCLCICVFQLIAQIFEKTIVTHLNTLYVVKMIWIFSIFQSWRVTIWIQINFERFRVRVHSCVSLIIRIFERVIVTCSNIFVCVNKHVVKIFWILCLMISSWIQDIFKRFRVYIIVFLLIFFQFSYSSKERFFTNNVHIVLFWISK